MSVIRKKPFIESVIESLTDEQKASLLSVMNGSGNTIDASFTNLPEADVAPVLFQLEPNNLKTGILIQAETYDVLLAYHRFQDMQIYKLDLSKFTYEKINEYLDINELRRTISGGGGNQPTLFAPIITVSDNNVTWERDSRNGGFNDVLDATIDNESVSKPLTITAELDNKLLKVKSVAENFKDGVATKVLEYATITPVAKKIVIEINGLQNNSTSSSYPYVYLRLKLYGSWGNLSNGRGKFVYNNVEYVFGANDINSFLVPLNVATGRQEIDLYFEKPQTDSQGNGITLKGYLFRANEQVSAGTNVMTTISGTTPDGIRGDCYALWNNEEIAHNVNGNYVDGVIPLSAGIMTYYFEMATV